MSYPFPITDGLYSWYNVEGWNGSTWSNSASGGSGAFTETGNVKRLGKFLFGSPSDALTLASGAVPANYTIFHIARYFGDTQGRIITNYGGANSVNWLDGFHNYRDGVAYHGGWITPEFISSYSDKNNFIYSSSQKSLHRVNGVLRGNSGGTTNSMTSLKINVTTSEPSDWAIMELIIFNRVLSSVEIEQMETYMATKINQIDFSSLRDILGQTGAISLNQLYSRFDAPASGAISFANFTDIRNPIVLHKRNWYNLLSRVTSGGFTPVQAGSDPDVQIQMASSAVGGNYNGLSYNFRIQDLRGFRVEYEYYISGGADGLAFKVGRTSGGNMGGENPGYSAFTFNLQIYTGGARSRQIYIWDNNSTQIYAGSSIPVNTWTPVVIEYKKGTSNYTWRMWNNGTNIFNYNDDDNATWLNNSGPYFGFASRTGGVKMNAYIRRVRIFPYF